MPRWSNNSKPQYAQADPAAERRPALLTIKDVCREMRISEPTLRRMMARKEIVPVKVNGSQVRFTPDAIDGYYQAQMRAYRA